MRKYLLRKTDLQKLALSNFLLVLLILFSGCASIVQFTGELLDGRAFSEKSLSVYRSVSGPRTELRDVLLNNGEKEIVITSRAYPGLKLRGRRMANNALFFTQAEFVSYHIHGWNEFTLELSGTGNFYESGSLAILNMPITPEGIVISGGKIRYKESRIGGDTALARLRNRQDRILALTEWMAQFETPVFLSQKEFENYWKALIFPELVSKNKRTANYQHYILPDDLFELKNSGTLLRDWEESLSWIYLEYTWDGIAAFFDGMEFRKTK